MQSKTHTKSTKTRRSRSVTRASAQENLTLRDVMLDMSEDVPIARCIARNRTRTKSDLRNQVLVGRDTQHVLSEQIQAARTSANRYAVSDLAEQRRLCHIATILARAELLTRPHTKSLSLYEGAEAKVDDATIIERAKGFARMEAEQTLSADDRAYLVAALKRYEVAKASLLPAAK